MSSSKKNSQNLGLKKKLFAASVDQDYPYVKLSMAITDTRGCRRTAEAWRSRPGQNTQKLQRHFHVPGLQFVSDASLFLLRLPCLGLLLRSH